MASVLLLQMFSPMINVEQVRANSGSSEPTITPNWTIESVKHVTNPFDPIALPSWVDSDVDYEVTIKTTFDDEVYNYNNEGGITVNTIMTIPEWVKVWYPYTEDWKNITWKSANHETTDPVIYGMKWHPLSAITWDMTWSVYVKVTDWSKNGLEFSLKLVDAQNTSAEAYGEESFTIKRSSYKFDLTNSETDLPPAKGILTNNSVLWSGWNLNQPNENSINALKTAIFWDSSTVDMSDHLVELSLKASDSNWDVWYTAAKLNNVSVTKNWNSLSDEKLQVFLYSVVNDKWYDLVTQWWGSLNSWFNLYANESTDLKAYVFADKEWEYKLDFSVVNLRDNNSEIVSGSHTINVWYIPFEWAWGDLNLKIQWWADFDTKEITRDRDGNVKITIEWKNIDRIEFDHSYDWDNRFNFEDVLEEKLNSELLNTLTWWLLSGGKNESLDSMELIEWHLFPNEEEPFCEECDIECLQLWLLVLKAIWITATYTKEGDNQKWELTLPKVLIDQFDAENNKKTITFYHTITSENKKYWSMHNVQDENTFKYLIKERTSGGGGSSSSTNNDNKEDKTEETENTENTETESESTFTAEQLQEAIKDSPYDKEQNDAYLFALKNGITTMNTVEKARISDPLTRWEFAKMIATYAIKILEKEIDQTKLEECSFSDTDGIGDLGNFSKLACGMGLMWQNMWDTFQPNNKITRAEVVTVISRMYGWTQDNTSWNYFANHMKEMHERWYIKNTNPTMDEIRWYIFIMLQRIADWEK